MAGTNYFTLVSANTWVALTEEEGTLSDSVQPAMLAKCIGVPVTTPFVFGPGCLMIRTDNTTLYQQTGTFALPVWTLNGGGSGGQVSQQFQDEGVNLGTSGTVDTVNLVGAGITGTRLGNTVTLTVPAGQASIQFQDDNVNLGTSGTVDTIDFAGTGVTTTRLGNEVTVTIPAGQASVQYQDENVNLGTSGTVDTIDFAGAGVTATRIGNEVTVTIPGGGVTSFNGNTGAIVVAGGTDISVVEAPANTFTVNYTGAGGTGLSNYAEFYQTVADVAGTIAADNGKALFQSAGAANSAGFTMIAASGDITVTNAGVYEINWEITCAEAGAMSLYIGAAKQAGTCYGTGAGTQNISGSSLLTLGASDVVSLRSDNCPAALTLQLAGTTNTGMIVAGITLKKIA